MGVTVHWFGAEFTCVMQSKGELDGWFGDLCVYMCVCVGGGGPLS